MKSKKEIRKTILEKRNALTKAEHREKSQRITELIVSSKQFQNSDIYLLFASYKSEVDTTGIIQYALSMGKPIYLPKVMGSEMEYYQIQSMEDLKEGYRGIQEPQVNPSLQFIPPKDKKIFVLMPGAVFDKGGGRIGYGGGFYDKFLKRLETEIPQENLCKMAVAFECQMIDEGVIIREKHDIAPDDIVTENTVYCIKNDLNPIT